MNQVCPVCRNPGGTVECERCHVFHHHDCWKEMGGKCSIFGCAEPSEIVEVAPPRPLSTVAWDTSLMLASFTWSLIQVSGAAALTVVALAGGVVSLFVVAASLAVLVRVVAPLLVLALMPFIAVMAILLPFLPFFAIGFALAYLLDLLRVD